MNLCGVTACTTCFGFSYRPLPSCCWLEHAEHTVWRAQVSSSIRGLGAGLLKGSKELFEQVRPVSSTFERVTCTISDLCCLCLAQGQAASVVPEQVIAYSTDVYALDSLTSWRSQARCEASVAHLEGGRICARQL